MKDTIITNRIELLRKFMRDKNLKAFIIPTTDPHSGEYTPEYWESRKWISGFTGSAGTVVITMDRGGLWTDSRYFLQAEEQLHDTGITLFKERMPHTPSITDWLKDILIPGDKVGVDGSVNTTYDVLAMTDDLAKDGIRLTITDDPFVEIWHDRPSLPDNPIFTLDENETGEDCNSKISRIKSAFRQNGADAVLISALDEIAWILNMRGNDIHCNPVFIAYLLITEQETTLFVSESKLTRTAQERLKENRINIEPYENANNYMNSLKCSCLQISDQTNYSLYSNARSATKVLLSPSPVLWMKAIKNEAEIKGFHNAMKRDGVAMVRFIMWLKEAVHTCKENEVSIDHKLYEIRSQQERFKGISFDTIAGYQAHGAIVHYEATPQTASTLYPEGMLLLDSGGQYTDGTTDITRTLVLGPVTEEQKEDYTLVLKGMINLAMAVFPQGTCGTQLDILARQAMWKAGINYGHGTGHGVGHFLNVHEGPHQIRMNHIPAPLVPGMTVTDEPGIYKAGKHGIRIENTMLVVPHSHTDFGDFYAFEPLTLCPIDKEAILTRMLNKDEREWLNAYHQRVYKTLSPLLTKEECDWLQQATAAL